MNDEEDEVEEVAFAREYRFSHHGDLNYFLVKTDHMLREGNGFNYIVILNIRSSIGNARIVCHVLRYSFGTASFNPLIRLISCNVI